MAKIIRAYTEEKQAPSMNLLKSINAGEQLQEKEFLQKLGNALGGKGFKSDETIEAGKKAVATAATPDRARSDTAAQGVNDLEKIIGEVVNTSDERYVLFTNTKFLQSAYLKAGGGKLVIDSVTTDEDLAKVAKHEAVKNFALVKMEDSFKFSDLLKTPSQGFDTSIILDIPKVIDDNLQKAANSNDPKAIRTALEAMMSFKYYVLSLKIPESKDVAEQMDAEHEMRKQLAIFNPSIIRNYPHKATWDSAKSEWYKTQGDGKEEADIEKSEKSAELQKRKTALSAPAPDAALKKSLLNALMTASDAKGAASGMATMYKGTKTTKAAIIAALNSLYDDYETPKIRSTVATLQAAAYEGWV
jgi:hypothetical protein